LSQPYFTVPIAIVPIATPPRRARKHPGARDLPAAVRDIIISSYNDALTPVFLYLVPLVVVAEILLCFVLEKPLATTIERDILPETLEIDGATHVRLEQPTRAEPVSR
jgi:hypothetical protein